MANFKLINNSTVDCRHWRSLKYANDKLTTLPLLKFTQSIYIYNQKKHQVPFRDCKSRDSNSHYLIPIWYFNVSSMSISGLKIWNTNHEPMRTKPLVPAFDHEPQDRLFDGIFQPKVRARYHEIRPFVWNHGFGVYRENVLKIERLILKGNVGVHIFSQRLVLLDSGQCLKSLLLDSLAGQRMPNKIETTKLIHFQFKFAARCNQHQRPEVSHGQWFIVSFNKQYKNLAVRRQKWWR